MSLLAIFRISPVICLLAFSIIAKNDRNKPTITNVVTERQQQRAAGNPLLDHVKSPHSQIDKYQQDPIEGKSKHNNVNYNVGQQLHPDNPQSVKANEKLEDNHPKLPEKPFLTSHERHDTYQQSPSDVKSTQADITSPPVEQDPNNSNSKHDNNIRNNLEEPSAPADNDTYQENSSDRSTAAQGDVNSASDGQDVNNPQHESTSTDKKLETHLDRTQSNDNDTHQEQEVPSDDSITQSNLKLATDEPVNQQHENTDKEFKTHPHKSVEEHSNNTDKLQENLSHETIAQPEVNSASNGESVQNPQEIILENETNVHVHKDPAEEYRMSKDDNKFQETKEEDIKPAPDRQDFYNSLHKNIQNTPEDHDHYPYDDNDTDTQQQSLSGDKTTVNPKFDSAEKDFQILDEENKITDEKFDHEHQHIPVDEHSNGDNHIHMDEKSTTTTPDDLNSNSLVEDLHDSETGNHQNMDIEKHEHHRPNPLLEHVHSHSDYDKCHKNDDEDEDPEYNLRSSFILALRHLSSTLINFLPEYMQDTILDVNDALVFTGIIALTLISICVPYFFIDHFLSIRPLKKKVTDLNKTLWKVSTAFENQQEEYDMYKKKALAYDEDKKEIEELQLELHLVKQIEIKLKEENRSLKKRLNADAKVAGELEGLITSTMFERDQIIEDRDKLKSIVANLQSRLKETVENLETSQADFASCQMDLELLSHTNANLELRAKALEKEIGELKSKFHAEVDLRRGLQTELDKLNLEKNSIQEELTDLKNVLRKYEETVNNLNDEISVKENELMALKETLGEDSPLVDIAESTARFQVAERQVESLQSRVESLTLENSSLARNYEKTNETLKELQLEKDQAENRLQVLEAYFKEKEDELRRMVEKHEMEKEVRGKDKEELVLMIEEKKDEVRDLKQRLEKLTAEFEETKLAHRSEIRALEAKGHETWLSLCQSERKAQDVRKEAELLRQKLTAITKANDAEGNDAFSLNGEMPYIFSQLDLDEVPLPLPEEPILPSYFGLGDFEPPVPIDDDEDEDTSVIQNHHEPRRPPPVGRISPNYSDQDDDEADLSPIRGVGTRTERRDEFSDGSSSPPPPENGNGGSRENYMNGSLHSRRRQPLNTSSPLQHGLNL